MSDFQSKDPNRKISPAELRLRHKLREKRRKQRQKKRLIGLAVVVILLIGLIFFTVKGMKGLLENKEKENTDSSSSASQSQSESQVASSSSQRIEDSQQTQVDSQAESSASQNIDVSSTTNSNDWRMILANKNTPLPDGYAPELQTLADSQLQMQKEAAQAFDEMRKAANATGLTLMACSAYRSVERQQELFNAEIEKWKGKGMNQQEAEQKATTVVMIPGRSEHNTGLAVDVGSVTNQRIEEDFEKEPEFAWLQEHAAEYGFILRYPKDKQAITGVTYEPWHYRYVGVENAKKIKEKGLCLEEYLTLH